MHNGFWLSFHLQQTHWDLPNLNLRFGQNIYTSASGIWTTAANRVLWYQHEEQQKAWGSWQERIASRKYFYRLLCRDFWREEIRYSPCSVKGLHTINYLHIHWHPLGGLEQEWHHQRALTAEESQEILTLCICKQITRAANTKTWSTFKPL